MRTRRPRTPWQAWRPLAALTAIALLAGFAAPVAAAQTALQIVEVTGEGTELKVVPPGVKVTQLRSIAPYDLDGMTLPTETEPNDTAATANALASNEVVLLGTISPARRRRLVLLHRPRRRPRHCGHHDLVLQRRVYRHHHQHLRQRRYDAARDRRRQRLVLRHVVRGVRDADSCRRDLLHSGGRLQHNCDDRSLPPPCAGAERRADCGSRAQQRPPRPPRRCRPPAGRPAP